MRFSDFPSLHAARAPDAPAVVFEEMRWNYGELDRRVEECAKALLACGIARGDRVAMLATPRPEYAVVFLATARIGAIWVGLNPVQQLDEYRYILSDTQPAIIFAFERLRERDNHQILLTLKSEYPCARRFVLFDGPMAGFLSYEAFIALGRGVSDRELAAGVAGVLPGDAALIVYTSGSTGKPKGAVLTQLNIAHWTTLYRELWPRTPLRVICNLPVTHIGCCVETLAFALAAGGTIVFQE
ncbi:MAG TPA: AMP-binding protein, partial [Dongiaceae bacterium]